MREPALVQAATAPLLDLDRVKLHLNVDGSDHDALIEEYIAGAAALLERRVGMALAPQTWRWTVDGFPVGYLRLPLGPVVSVTAIRYVDALGVERVLASSAYRLDRDRVEAAIHPIDAWPATKPQAGAVTVEWVAGDVCPPDLREAARELVAYWYDNRDAAREDVPPGVAGAIKSHRRFL